MTATEVAEPSLPSEQMGLSSRCRTARPTMTAQSRGRGTGMERMRLRCKKGRNQGLCRSAGPAYVQRLEASDRGKVRLNWQGPRDRQGSDVLVCFARHSCLSPRCFLLALTYMRPSHSAVSAPIGAPRLSHHDFSASRLSHASRRQFPAVLSICTPQLLKTLTDHPREQHHEQVTIAIRLATAHS